jgi:hypothetical protein
LNSLARTAWALLPAAAGAEDRVDDPLTPVAWLLFTSWTGKLGTVLAWPPTLPPTNHDGAHALARYRHGFAALRLLAVRGVGAGAIAAITASQISFVAFSC